jgi:quercetin 2,3-dioxygenase
MIAVRRAGERGRTRTGWLDSRHTFSFGHYQDPAFQGFGDLLVINDDTVAPAGGFGTHGHRDMEILTYVLSGGLEHKDSLGTGSVIRAGEAQRMSAGTGIRHSEFNASKTEPVRFLQLWILPEREGLAPGYEQKPYSAAQKRGRLQPIAAPDARQGALTLHQDAVVYATVLGGAPVTHAVAAGRRAWVQVATGALTLNGIALHEGDGAAIADEATLTLAGAPEAEALVFDLAA